MTDLSLSVYERECERYGGKDLIRFAEKVFEMDSIFVEILKEKNITINLRCQMRKSRFGLFGESLIVLV